MLDYQKIYKKAESLNISPHLLVKREINYRKAKQREPDCRFCVHLRFVGYKQEFNRRKQCAIIGESISHHADIKTRKENKMNSVKEIGDSKEYDYHRSTIREKCDKCSGRRYKDTKGNDFCIDCGKNYN